MKVYADTSFLASLYCLDAHSALAAKRVQEIEPEVLLTPLTELELTNALHLRIFRKEASSTEIRQAKSELEKHIRSGFYSAVAMPPTSYALAKRIAQRRTAAAGSRTLDILHVACALLLHPDLFWTFDERQAALARAEGLRVR